MSQGTKVSKTFLDAKFSTSLECLHMSIGSTPNTRHDIVNPQSKPFQLLLSVVSKTIFMRDLERLKHGSITSSVESFHSVSIRYRPKRKFFPIRGFQIRTMLSVFAWNENRAGELRGDREITYTYEAFSKAKGKHSKKLQKNVQFQVKTYPKPKKARFAKGGNEIW